MELMLRSIGNTLAFSSRKCSSSEGEKRRHLCTPETAEGLLAPHDLEVERQLSKGREFVSIIGTGEVKRPPECSAL
jgi:hypothetical protein